MKIAAACKEGLLCAPDDAESYLVYEYQKGALVGRERLEGARDLAALAGHGVRALLCSGTSAGNTSGIEIFADRSGDPLDALLDLTEAGLIADPDLCGGACGTCSGCH